MKKILVLTGFLCGFLFSNAQKDSSFFELGLNVFPILKNVSQGNSDLKINPYALTAEYKFNGILGLRAGVGYHASSSNEQPSLTNGNNNFIRDTSSMDLRFGLVLHKNFNEKWSLKYGVDAVIEKRSSSDNTIFTNVNGQRNETLSTFQYDGFGVAPFVFAQYHFSGNFSIGTELSFRFVSGNSNRKTENTEFPDFNTEASVEHTDNGVLWPTALFLIVRF